MSSPSSRSALESRGAPKERPILFSAPMVRAILAGRKTQTRRLVKPQPNPKGSYVIAPGWMGWMDIDDMERVAAAAAHRDVSEHSHSVRCPYGQPGDRLWVRETWCSGYGLVETTPGRYLGDAVGVSAAPRTLYRADGAVLPPGTSWRPSIFMKRDRSRLTLEIESVRVERLQDISEEDAKAEGAEPSMYPERWSAYDPETDGYPEFFAEPDRAGLESIRYHPPRPMSTAREGFERLWNQINGDRASWESNPWAWVVGFKQVQP